MGPPVGPPMGTPDAKPRFSNNRHLTNKNRDYFERKNENKNVH